MKLLLRNQSVNIRSLYQRSDKTYCVRIETWDFEKRCYNPSYDINFGMFNEAWDCVNFKDKK